MAPKPKNVTDSIIVKKQGSYLHYNTATMDLIYNYIENIEEYTTQKQMCFDLNVSFNTWKKWLKTRDDVKALRDMFSEKVQVLIFNAGLRKEYDSSLVKFYMMSQHGWTTKQQDRVHEEAVKKNEIALNVAKVQLMEMTEALTAKTKEKQSININFGLKLQDPEDIDDD